MNDTGAALFMQRGPLRYDPFANTERSFAMSEHVTAFFAAWSMPDDAARAAQIEGTLGDTIEYADPRTAEALVTAAAVIDYVGQFSKMAPGMPVAAVHQSDTLNFVRATVRFGDGDQAQWGQYVADLDAAGRITRLIGFVGTGATE